MPEQTFQNGLKDLYPDPLVFIAQHYYEREKLNKNLAKNASFMLLTN
jgi:hypothetical protein